MLRCTIELIPGGREDHPRRRILQVVEIANKGGTDARGDYYGIIRTHRKDGRVTTYRQGSITDFPRLSKTAAHLLQRMLNHLLNHKERK